MAKLTDKRTVLRRIQIAKERVSEDIARHASRSKIAAGLSTEGFDGGYRQALYDVEAALTHGYPSGRTSYWPMPGSEAKE